MAKLPGIKIDAQPYDDKYAFLDIESVKTKLYEFQENEIAKTTFYIPTIHCVSCIWLLEHLNKLNDGIKHSSVNFITKTCTITFNTSEISIRQLVELLRSIHYIPDISLQSLEKNNNKKINKSLIYKTGIAGFIFGNVMLFSLPQYFNGRPVEGSLGLFFNYIAYFLTLPLVFYCGSDYLISAWKGLKQKIVNIDLPIALGIITLFIVTSIEVLWQIGQGYSDSLSGLLFFLLVGKWYQSKTYQALSFDRDYKSYFPIAVTSITSEGEKSTLLKDINNGDILLIRNKELIPADSELISGTALIDYSFVTGESTRIKKECGDFLYAGGIQTLGAITVKVINEVQQSQLTQLWNQSKDKKPEVKSLLTIIDRISLYFTLSIIIIALSGFGFWWYKGEFRTAVMVFTSVLIITCPCALALSMPFTFGNAMRMLGMKGIYLKNSQVIERLTRIDTIVFDKTGTITVPDENNIQYIGKTLSDIELNSVVSIARQSTHPLSGALSKYYSQIYPSLTEGFTEIAGRGIYSKVNGLSVKIGSQEFVQNTAETINISASKIYISIDDNVKGYFIFSNKYREGFADVIKSLQIDYKTYLLSGDNDYEKETLLNYFDKDELFFEQKPSDKMHFITKLQENGHNVLMTGDGLNDAGAFMQSNVALSIAGNIYHFSPAGDAIIEASKFAQLSQLIKYAKTSLNIVKISFILSFLYNIAGLIYALSGTLSPVVGAILMPISSVSVVAFATLSTRLAAKSLKHINMK